MTLQGKNIKKSIGALLITFFLGYVACVSLFPHTHIVEGRSITHSHPYSGGAENPGHTHTTAQFQAIHFLSLFVALCFAAMLLACLWRGVTEFVYAASESGNYSSFHLNYSLRGPPAC